MNTREEVWGRFADAVGVSVSKSAELLGYKNRSIISKEKNRPVGARLEMKIRRFCERVGLNAEWILTGEGDIKEDVKGGDELDRVGELERELALKEELIKEFKSVIKILRRVCDANAVVCPDCGERKDKRQRS